MGSSGVIPHDFDKTTPARGRYIVSMNGPGPNSYLRDAVLTASPEQLQLMLYDGAIRYARQGRDAMLAKDFEGTYEKLSRAQAIVSEMETGLRHEVNPELCDRMASIYSFIFRKLVDASLTRDTEPIDAALKLLHMERETWVLLMEKVVSVKSDVADQALVPASSEPGSLSVEG